MMEDGEVYEGEEGEEEGEEEEEEEEKEAVVVKKRRRSPVAEVAAGSRKREAGRGLRPSDASTRLRQRGRRPTVWDLGRLQRVVRGKLKSRQPLHTQSM